MPRAAKIYISLVLSAGAAVLLLAAGAWSSASLPQFFTLLGFAAVASTLKLRIPGMESTLSPNFLFILLAMPSRSFSEVASIALVAALVQSLWFAKHPRLVQVAFSAAALVLSASGALLFTRYLLGANAANSPIVFAVLAGSLYLPLNTALVSAVIGLVEGKRFLQVARTCYDCIFPYFMGGILFAGIVGGAVSSAAVGRGAAILFPVAILGYLYSTSRIRSLAPAPVQSAPVPMENEELVGTRSNGHLH